MSQNIRNTQDLPFPGNASQASKNPVAEQSSASTKPLWRPAGIDSVYLQDPAMVRVLQRITPQSQALYERDPHLAALSIMQAYNGEKLRHRPHVSLSDLLPGGVRAHVGELPDGRMVCFKSDDNHINGMQMYIGRSTSMTALKLLAADRRRDGITTLTTNIGIFYLSQSDAPKIRGRIPQSRPAPTTFVEAGATQGVALVPKIQNSVLSKLKLSVPPCGKTFVGTLPDDRTICVTPDAETKSGWQAYFGTPNDMQKIPVHSSDVFRDGGTRRFATQAGILLISPKRKDASFTDIAGTSYVLQDTLQQAEDAAIAELKLPV